MQMYTPGPTNLHKAVVDELVKLPPYFAGKDFGKIVYQLNDYLFAEFKMESSRGGCTLIGTGSGTAGMEAVVRNLVDSTKSTLTLSCGKYGRLFHNMCLRVNPVSPVILESEDGAPPSFTRLRNILVNDVPDVVFLTYTETTTGVKSPVHEYAQIIKLHAPKCKIVLDAIASTHLDELTCSLFDVIIKASQKAMGSAPGLFFVYVDNAVLPVKSAPLYFDFDIERGRSMTNKTSHTPADRLFCATLKALEIPDRKLDKRLRLAEHMFSSWLKVPKETRATSVLALSVPGSARKIQDLLIKRHNILVATGVRGQEDNLIRIRIFGKDLGVYGFASDMDSIQKTIKEIHG